MKSRTRYTMPLLLAMLLLSMTACGTKEEPNNTQTPAAPPAVQETQQQEQEETPQAKGPFEEFTVTDLDGNEVTQSIFEDYDLTVINVWGTFCGPCISEMPELKELSEEYAEKGVQIIGLVGDGVDQQGKPSDSAIAEAKKIIEKTGADYLHILPTGEMFYNVMGQITGVPTTIFVDSEGKQVDVAYVGARNKKAWSKLIDKALETIKAE